MKGQTIKSSAFAIRIPRPAKARKGGRTVGVTRLDLYRRRAKRRKLEEKLIALLGAVNASVPDPKGAA
jgi:hypothetical protein